LTFVTRRNTVKFMQWILAALNRQWAEHVARTTVAATLSLLAARAVGLSEAYWAAITTMIAMQSTLGAAWTISLQRLAGTVLGAAGRSVARDVFRDQRDRLRRRDSRSGNDLRGSCTWIARHTGFPGSLWLSLCLLRAKIRWSRRCIVSSRCRYLGIVGGLLITAVWPERQAGSAKQ
jgi:hypothetical protein